MVDAKPHVEEVANHQEVRRAASFELEDVLMSVPQVLDVSAKRADDIRALVERIVEEAFT